MENNRTTLLTWLNTKLILGIFIFLSACVGAYAFYQSRALDNTLSVTGSATKEVVSDHVKWVGSITRMTRVSTLTTGYAEMARDLQNVKTFLKNNGIPETAIVISPVFMEQNYDPNPTGAEKTYTLRQTIDVNSADVAKITDLAKNTQALIEKGVVFSTQSLEYTYSKLPEERVALLGAAVADAKARASELAESSGKRIGKLKAASSGVVQVLSRNSLEVSDYGAYDTSKIDKTIMVTVKASFSVR